MDQNVAAEGCIYYKINVGSEMQKRDISAIKLITNCIYYEGSVFGMFYIMCTQCECIVKVEV